MVVSYIAEASDTHPSDTSRLRHWRVVLMEQQRRHILASYEEVIDEDAGRTISESTVWIDTAPYMLTPTQRAFAIRLDIETSPSYGDGGLSDYMTLFVTEGHALKPVIHLLPTRFWYFRSPNPCLYPSISPVTERAQSTFQLLPSQHHGYFDIHMISTAHTTANSADGSETLLSQRRFSNTFAYNGKEYDIPGWELLPSPQWWPE
ncbi:hypothetical protein C4K68_24560 [Pokkaliibacter plantistimulans]|uniref:Uncharacterized protein n=1 Tax=Proteobacteria bacterium 228 TaxID=2083153 RepID=A0A2S5KI62_9PROT|nr:hypothetical protein [Pokkaliibacter plantistimulans]PPC74504.1 hypothetical protein C4K68_24560 [Pokkaliibacter plantistimulans]